MRRTLLAMAAIVVAPFAVADFALASGYQDFNAGAAAGNRGDTDAAIAAMTRALSAADLPDHLRATALLGRGEAYAQKKQFDAAVSDYSLALKLRPDDIGILLNRAIALRLGDRLEPSLADEDAAIRLRPYYVPAYLQRMATDDALGRYADEMADCNTLLADWPEDKAAFLADRAQVYLRLAKYEQAETDASDAIDANSKTADVYVIRARARILSDSLDRAQHDLDRALEIDENDASALDTRGLVEWDLGAFDRAAADFRSALKHNSADAYAALGLQITKFKSNAMPDGELAASAAALDLKAWSGLLTAFYLGRLSESDLGAAAAVGSAPQQALRNCEREFFVGEWKLAHADPAGGTALLARAAAICSPDGLVRESARADLKRMQTAGNAP
jgi:tetratricopeptide (TPR) repeat protein